MSREEAMEERAVAGLINLEFVVQERINGLLQLRPAPPPEEFHLKNHHIKDLLKQLHAGLKATRPFPPVLLPSCSCADNVVVGGGDTGPGTACAQPR